MSKDDLHAAASSALPGGTEIPKTWVAIVALLFSKAGLGAVFLLMLVPVYLDLKESNERYVKLSEANIVALTALSANIEKAHTSVGTMQETIRRIEFSISDK